MKYVGMRPKYPVEAYAVAGGEFESTRIDWDDYERMGYIHATN
jgi:hypothetical protein